MPRPRTQRQPQPSADSRGLEPSFGFLATQSVVTALDLGLFQRLTRGPATAQALARSAKVNRRATTMVLDALVGLNALIRRRDRYDLPPRVKQILNSPGVDAETYFDDWLDHLNLLASNWSRLSEVVKTGKPVQSLGTVAEGEKVLPALARRLFPANYCTATEVVEGFPKSVREKPLRVLDVAAGSAAWSIPFAEANPRTEVVAIDFDAVLDVARHFTSACGVEGQYMFAPGDLRKTRFGTNAYDLVILGHICHSEGAARTRRLFRKVSKALRPGGRMLVAEMIADEHRVGAGTGPFPLLFALNMLVHTEEGGTFSLSEHRAWAKAAGFRRSKLIHVPAPSPIMLFQK